MKLLLICVGVLALNSCVWLPAFLKMAEEAEEVSVVIEAENEEVKKELEVTATGKSTPKPAKA